MHRLKQPPFTGALRFKCLLISRRPHAKTCLDMRSCHVQPNNHALLFETVLRELALREHLSIAMGCGLVRVLHMHKKTSLALSDLRTADWLCKTLALCYAVTVWDNKGHTQEGDCLRPICCMPGQPVGSPAKGEGAI